MEPDASGEDRTAERVDARERIVTAAYDLLARQGIRATGVDELIERSGVAKATFYRHFRSKDDVVLAYLKRWFEARTAAIESAVDRYGNKDGDAVLAIFDVFDDWFQEGAAQVSSFLHVLMEMGVDHPLGRASLSYLQDTRTQIAALARTTGLRDPEDFAWSVHILLKGSMVAAVEGDARAAARAKELAADLIERHSSPNPMTAAADPA